MDIVKFQNRPMCYLKKYLLFIFIIFSFPIHAEQVDLAKAANDNPFLNGELNLEYKGQTTALAGEIMDIKNTKQGYPLYKLNLRLKGVNSIWVTSIAPSHDSDIDIGDMIIFRGYISSALELDPSGKLEELIKSKALLLALKAENP